MQDIIEKFSALAVEASVYAFGDYGLSSVLAATGAATGVAFAQHERMSAEYKRVLASTSSKVEAAFAKLDVTEDDEIAIQQMAALISERASKLTFDPTELAVVAREEGRFEDNAASYILSKLKIAGADAEAPVAFQFAQSVLVHSLEAARENESFYQPLQLELLFGIRQEVAEIRAELIERSQDRAEEFGIAKGYLFGIVRSYTPDDPSNLDDAFRSIERALREAKEQRDSLALPTNLPDAVNRIVKRVAELNETDRMDEATALLEAEIAASEEREAAEQANRLRLLRRAVAQAIETGNESLAVRSELLRVEIEVPDSTRQFSHLLSVAETWWVKGTRHAIRFDLKVAAELSREIAFRASNQQEVFAAWLLVGKSFAVLGTRASNTDSEKLLRDASNAFLKAVEAAEASNLLEAVVGAKLGLGNALSTLGFRHGDGLAVVRAETALQEALDTASSIGNRPARAMILNSLGGFWAKKAGPPGTPNGTAYRFKALDAFQDCLKFYKSMNATNEQGRALHNIGNLYLDLGIETITTGGSFFFENAVQALEDGRLFRPKLTQPARWSTSTISIAKSLNYLSLFDPSVLAEKLAAVIEDLNAAIEITGADNMPRDHSQALKLRDEIQAKLADLKGGKG